MDTRGQSMQIGAILLFASLIVALSVYIATVVPQENKSVEFKHYQEVKDDLKVVRDAVLSAGGSGTTQSTSIQLGTTYPVRVFAINPPPPTGSLRTAAKGNIQFNSSVDVEGVCGYTGTAQALVYSPDYNELNAAPVGYDNTAVYLNRSGDYVILTEQSLIDQRTIQLTPLNASYSASGDLRETLTFKGGPANGTTKTFDNPLVMTIPTRLPASLWNSSDKLFGDVSRVTSVEPAQQDNAVDVTLEPATYTIACRAVSVNSFPASGSAQPPGIDTTGYGEGGNEIYDPEDPTAETISTKGGRLVGIVNASNVVLQKPAFAPTEASSGQISTNGRYLRLGFVIQNGTLSEGNYTKFYFVLGSAEGMYYKVPSDSLSWGSKNVYLYRENASESTTPLIDGELLATSQLNGWVRRNEGLDLLNEVNYVNSEAVSSDLESVESFLNNTEKTSMTITNIHGRVDVNVTAEFNQSLGGTASVEKIVFRGTEYSDLKTIGTDNVVTTYSNPSKPLGIGPLTADLGIRDGSADIPFKSDSNSYLRAVNASDADGAVETLDETQVSGAPMDVGDWDGDGNVEVIYFDGNSQLSQYEPASGTKDKINDQSGSPVTGAAVAGVGDIDDDNTLDVTFVGNVNDRLKYIETDGTDPQALSTGSLDAPTAVSQPADLDDDGTQEVAVYNGNSGIDLYDQDGFDVSYNPQTYDVKGTPMTVIDWRQDPDGTPDIILVDSNGILRYLDWTGKDTGKIEDSNGNPVKASGGSVGVR